MRAAVTAPAGKNIEMQVTSKRRSLKSLLTALAAGACLGLAPAAMPTASAATWAPASTAPGGSITPPSSAPPAGGTPFADDVGAPPSDPDANDAPVIATGVQPGDATSETICDDGIDNDGDTVYDCGDNDCKSATVCQADGRPEFTEERCHDWVDNDKDGAFDCDDSDCSDMQACKGSWDRASAPTSGVAAGRGPGAATDFDHKADPEDLLGKGQDADGERSEHMCSDGYDNDHDGKTDCEDLGCRLDTSVVNCQPATNFRFSVVARTQGTYNVQDKQANVEFSAIQLRVLGQIPYIQNSFFLLSFRAEKTPRMVFAIFQVPIKGGHYFNLNSGSGNLSLELVRSIHKRLLVDPAYYMLNGFEQGNGAAIEFGGPLDKRGKFLYRTFLAGGSGRFAGNVGGTFFPDNNNNFTYTAGAQLWMNLVGYYNRFDSPILYTPAPTTLSMALGGKWDQRSQERYPAVNFQTTFRYRRMIFLGEVYGKREINFGSWQLAYNLQLAVLPIKKRLLLAADFGQYLATEFERPPVELGYDLRRQNQEMQYRVAAHVFLWRELFMLTLIWGDRRVRSNPLSTDTAVVTKQQDLRLVFQYRF